MYIHENKLPLRTVQRVWLTQGRRSWETLPQVVWQSGPSPSPGVRTVPAWGRAHPAESMCCVCVCVRDIVWCFMSVSCVYLNLSVAGLFCTASLVLVRWSWAATTSGGGRNRFTADTCVWTYGILTSVCCFQETVVYKLLNTIHVCGGTVLWK